MWVYFKIYIQNYCFEACSNQPKSLYFEIYVRVA